MRETGHIRDYLGDIDDDLKHFDRNFAARFSGGGTAPLMAQNVDFTQYIDHIRDQQTTNACVGFAMTRAAHIRAQIMGIPMTHPSPVPPYTAARSMDFPEPDPLIDIGCRPRACALALSDPDRCALVPESIYPFMAHTINRRLPMHIFKEADGARFHYYRIAGDGSTRLDQVMRAMTLGHPVVFAIATDEAFQDYAGGLYRPEGKDTGSHMMCLVGYGAGCFVAVNSWGKFWGDNGLVRIPPDILGSALRCYDFMAIDFVEPA